MSQATVKRLDRSKEKPAAVQPVRNTENHSCGGMYCGDRNAVPPSSVEGLNKGIDARPSRTSEELKKELVSLKAEADRRISNGDVKDGKISAGLRVIAEKIGDMLLNDSEQLKGIVIEYHGRTIDGYMEALYLRMDILTRNDWNGMLSLDAHHGC